MIGTHDTSLIHIIVTRAEIDLSTIEAIYASAHGKALQVTHTVSLTVMSHGRGSFRFQ